MQAVQSEWKGKMPNFSKTLIWMPLLLAAGCVGSPLGDSKLLTIFDRSKSEHETAERPAIGTSDAKPATATPAGWQRAKPPLAATVRKQQGHSLTSPAKRKPIKAKIVAQLKDIPQRDVAAQKETQNVRTVSHQTDATATSARRVERSKQQETPGPARTLQIDGKTYRLTPVDSKPKSNLEKTPHKQRVSAMPINALRAETPESDQAESIHQDPPSEIKNASPESTESPTQRVSFTRVFANQDYNVPPLSNAAPISNAVQMNLPTVLASIDSQHPIVGFSRWRVQQAYAELAQAKSLWLPSLQAGFSFHRHDGNYQASNGAIVDVNRNSFQYGLGMASVGAGTTQRPGVVAQFHLADALFLPKQRKKTAWARGHAASATLNEQLRTAAVAYFDLLEAAQAQRISEESFSRHAELSRITSDFAEAGEGLQSDAERLQTELSLMQARLANAQEQTAVASSRLAQAISMSATETLLPMDASAVPMELVSLGDDKGSLIGTALATRPELKESQALVAAACDAYRREKLAPFVPSVLLGFSTGGFGGGLGNNLNNLNNRYDFDALMSWQVRNLGLGDRAARQRQSARIQQAKFEKLRLMDSVAREVSEAWERVHHRQNQIEATRQAIMTARQSYARNLERIRGGEGLPIEVLHYVQAFESAESAYLKAVSDFNRAQVQLLWAVGWSVTAPPDNAIPSPPPTSMEVAEQPRADIRQANNIESEEPRESIRF